MFMALIKLFVDSKEKVIDGFYNGYIAEGCGKMNLLGAS